jgi:hypothetical protein
VATDECVLIMHSLVKDGLIAYITFIPGISGAKCKIIFSVQHFRLMGRLGSLSESVNSDYVIIPYAF